MHVVEGAQPELETRVAGLEAAILHAHEHNRQARRDTTNQTIGFVVGAVWMAVLLWGLRR